MSGALSPGTEHVISTNIKLVIEHARPVSPKLIDTCLLLPAERKVVVKSNVIAFDFFKGPGKPARWTVFAMDKKGTWHRQEDLHTLEAVLSLG